MYICRYVYISIYHIHTRTHTHTHTFTHTHTHTNSHSHMHIHIPPPLIPCFFSTLVFFLLSRSLSPPVQYPNACVCGKCVCVQNQYPNACVSKTSIQMRVCPAHTWFCTHTHFPHTHAFGYSVWILYPNAHLHIVSTRIWTLYPNAHLDTISKCVFQIQKYFCVCACSFALI